MSVRDAPHQLIADLHGDLLREISAFTCIHWQGLGQAARALRKRNIIDGALTKKLILFDGAYNFSRHITVISANQFWMQYLVTASKHLPQQVVLTRSRLIPRRLQLTLRLKRPVTRQLRLQNPCQFSITRRSHLLTYTQNQLQ